MIRGENGKVERTLFYEDGTTELPLTDLSYLVAEVIQHGKVYATYEYLPTPDPVQDEIEEGDETNEVRIHISSALSETFKEGAVYIRLTMRKTDATYADGYKADIDEWTPFSVTV
jgi:hypothetical protein